MMLFGSGAFEIVFTAMFALVLSLIVFTVIRGIRQWHHNNQQPVLTVEATVIAKRTHISHSHHAVGGDVTGAHGFHDTSSTSYYVTFEVESGDRMEFLTDGIEYGMLAEGDYGRLTFQGTRYLGFERF